MCPAINQLINAIPCFQRKIDGIIKSNDCEEMFAYLDNITVGCAIQQEHFISLVKFLNVAESRNLTLNELKCVYNTGTTDLVRCGIKADTLQSDPKALSSYATTKQ